MDNFSPGRPGTFPTRGSWSGASRLQVFSPHHAAFESHELTVLLWLRCSLSFYEQRLHWRVHLLERAHTHRTKCCLFHRPPGTGGKEREPNCAVMQRTATPWPSHHLSGLCTLVVPLQSNPTRRLSRKGTRHGLIPCQDSHQPSAPETSPPCSRKDLNTQS